MKKDYFRRLLFLQFFFLVWGCICNPSSLVAQSKLNNEHWVGTWACAQMLVEPHNMPPVPGLSENTLRQIIRVSVGGKRLRLRFSNIFSDQPTVLKSVSVANVVNAPIVDLKTQKTLSFMGNPGITMNPGEEVFSDAFDFELQSGQLLAITIHYGATSAKTSGHPGSRTTSYLLQGDNLTNAAFDGAIKTDHWYTIMGLDVSANSDSATIVCLGNSITDGRGSGTNKQNRWTDILSARLSADKKTEKLGVLNLGIGGNCVVRGGLGPTALDRFDRDVLSQKGAKWLLILEGINDIGGIRRAEDAPGIAQDLIEAYKIMIDKAHAKGIKVYGCTILPFEKSFYDTLYRQEARDLVNSWIRNSNAFDAVIDFDKVMISEIGSKTILSNMHDGDFLHPNELGYFTMGQAVNIDLFK
ncbi:SGNH/GDSL hydrolase family protein [Flavobacterium sp. Fl-77]|uniref:SGNH/GDSL hydrolase family protein n=1 Tax=Flavobacterium flavipigmentatum TaxID=2893884 RepID=A0AAJ2SHC0_9FLAO|nr:MULTISPECIES: SGNH/GDSL hydrolase family protein [unclassified Flavobacterium]MDX6182768.1 SGNH/GDSL hydrolase family protein [Flavobacterium sp. Fl-33]MDX6186053.1 SGNH/GDSL hydrolase family protein [Flavobacterium sp. Fl-77]UFH38205.1 SGNH/GDSL hydrolase family protein [Flavobacterium sp. F-70]